jgi:hypothetical protein
MVLYQKASLDTSHMLHQWNVTVKIYRTAWTFTVGDHGNLKSTVEYNLA